MIDYTKQSINHFFYSFKYLMGLNQSQCICGPTREFACISLVSELKWYGYKIHINDGPDPHIITKMADQLLMGIVFLTSKNDDPQSCLIKNEDYPLCESRNDCSSERSLWQSESRNDRSFKRSLWQSESRDDCSTERSFWKLTAPFKWRGKYSWRNGSYRAQLLLNHQIIYGYGPTINVALVSLLSRIGFQNLDEVAGFQIRQLFSIQSDELKYETEIEPYCELTNLDSFCRGLFRKSNRTYRIKFKNESIYTENPEQHHIWLAYLK